MVPGLGNTRHKSVGQQEDLAILVLRRLTSPNLINYKILGFNSARGRVEKKKKKSYFKSIISVFIIVRCFPCNESVKVLAPQEQVA